MVRMRRYYEVDDDDVDERGVVRDGGRVHVPLMLTDAMQRDLAVRNRAPLLHQLGSVRLSDEDIEVKQRARDEWSARKRDAWRHQGAPSSAVRDGPTAVASRDGVDRRDPREIAYDERSARNRDAWRNPWPGAVR